MRNWPLLLVAENSHVAIVVVVIVIVVIVVIVIVANCPPTFSRRLDGRSDSTLISALVHQRFLLSLWSKLC